MKECITCKNKLPKHAYTKRSRNKDGLSNVCKTCIKKVNANTYTKRKNGVTPTIYKKVDFEDSLAGKHPRLLEFWDVEKNTIKPSNISHGSSYKASWHCKTCSYSWESGLTAMSKKQAGKECPSCNNKVTASGINDVFTTNPELKNWWNDTSIDPRTLTIKSKKQVQLSCKKGHTFKVALCRFRNTCPTCEIIEKSIGKIHPSLIKEWSNKNTLSPYEVSYNSALNIIWVCETCKKEWETVAYQRVNSETGCPNCSVKPFSRAEKEIVDFLKGIGVKVVENDRTILDGKELDIFLPDHNIAIEYNGLYWHSKKHKNYHYEKYASCKDKNIQLLQVWEDDWRLRKNIVKSFLKHKIGLSNLTRVYARKTVVKEIGYTVAKDFLDANHIQGGATGSHYVGLYYRDILVAVSVWTKSKDYEKQGKVTLDRYATSAIVIGGMGKLIKYMINNHNIKEITTFADHTVSDGSLYEKLGFNVDKTLKPDYSYIVNGVRVHKFSYRLKRFRSDPLLKFVEGFSETELAALNNISRVYDAGKTRYVMRV